MVASARPLRFRRRAAWLPALAGVLVGVVMVLSAGSFSPSTPVAHAPADQSPVSYVDPQFLPVTLSSPVPVFRGEFGDAVAIAGNTMVVGAPDEGGRISGPDGPFSYGCAYLYHGTNATVIPLCDDLPTTMPSFGSAVALGDGYVAVGNPGYNETLVGGGRSLNGSGEVNVYLASNGSFVESLFSPSPAANAEFGASVSISGDLLVIGAPGAAGAGDTSKTTVVLGAGEAYVVNLHSSEVRSLSSPAPQHLGAFGAAVAISGTTVVVGAPNETVGPHADGGNAYVFSATTGDVERTLLRGTEYTNASFGASVAINGSYVAVGAPSTNNSTGLSYVYDLTTGSQHVLPAPVESGGPSAERFGESVAINPSWVAVGAPNDYVESSPDAGAAYVYSTTAGTEIFSNLTPPQWPQGGNFGRSVALSGGEVLVGGPYEGSPAVPVGHAYLFTQIPLSYQPAPVATSSNFGYSVSVDQDAIALGAPDATAPAPNGTEEGHAGEVYYAPTEDSPLVRYTSPWGQAEGRYGWSVAASPTVLAVGAPGEEGGNGTVYVYNLTASLYPVSALYGNGSFGYALSMQGSELAIGAPTAYGGTGAVYVLNLTTWSLTTIPGPGDGDDIGLGLSVAVFGDQVLAGTPYTDADVGGAELFNATSGSLLARAVAPAGSGPGELGTSVALYRSTAVLGAPDEGNSTTGEGRALVYTVPAHLNPLALGNRLTYVATLGVGLFAGVGAFGETVAVNGGEIVVGAPRVAAFGVGGSGAVYLFNRGSLAMVDRYNAPVPGLDDAFGGAISLGPGGKLLVGDHEVPSGGLMVQGGAAPGATLFFL